MFFCGISHHKGVSYLVAVVKFALVEDGQKRVENGTVALEDLVQEGHGCRRQVPFGVADVLVPLQGCQ